MQRLANLLFVLIFLLAGIGCKDVYVSPYTAPSTGYLVVEGFISGNSTTRFSLSRTVKLPGTSGPPPEHGAKVQVEGSDNSIHPLPEKAAGVYSDSFALSPQAQYRLRIHTASGEDYLSAYVPFKITPPIDSVSWTNGPEGVTIYATSHDPSNLTRYYQWNWDQVYEYASGAYSSYKYVPATNKVVPRPDSEQIYHCWSSASSTSILVGTSAKLAQDVMSLFPVKHIAPDDIQLSVLYSILVRQYALTEDGYNFLSLMQKNTETLGSIFDAQPSQITGNVHSLTHPAEQVIGWVSAGTVTQQQLYIARSQVPSQYIFLCQELDTTLRPDTDLRKNFLFMYTPIDANTVGPRIISYIANYSSCVDCTLLGGTNKKPVWWPTN